MKGPVQPRAAAERVSLQLDEIAKVAYYSVAFHESDKPIGNK